MQTSRKNKISLSAVCVALIAAIVLTFAGCGKPVDNNPSDTPNSGAASENTAVDIGKGAHSFTLTVSADGSEKVYSVKSDRKTVGDALIELGIVEGESWDYGLYIKTVDGISADYQKDHAYWAFYINGEYANSGVDSTDIVDGAKYELKKEKS